MTPAEGYLDRQARAASRFTHATRSLSLRVTAILAPKCELGPAQRYSCISEPKRGHVRTVGELSGAG
jgi:hypothetical protein